MKEFERFFDDNSFSLQTLVDCGDAEFGLEELYQAFKSRMSQEIRDEAKEKKAEDLSGFSDGLHRRIEDNRTEA